MSFDLAGLRAAVADHGRVVRLVVAAVEGSAPREVGAAMLVWRGGQAGTIGGGALEFAAVAAAVQVLAAGKARLERVALGPGLGQCCGGSVKLLHEVWDSVALAGLSGDVVARAVGDVPMPFAVRRMLAAARGAGAVPRPRLVGGWMVEPVSRAKQMLWVWGAGHVGRALVAVLSPLPDVDLRWVDVDRARFPGAVPDGVTVRVAANPAELVAEAGPNDHHLIVTYSHALDLELCHQLLQRGFGSTGLIGSATKWARFRGRLAALGHAPDAILRITCPIGDPSLGKHPQVIAIGVASSLMARWQAGEAGGTMKERLA